MITVETKKLLKAIEKIKPFIPSNPGRNDNFFIDYRDEYLKVGYVCCGVESISFACWSTVPPVEGNHEPFSVSVGRLQLLIDLLKKFPDSIAIGFELPPPLIGWHGDKSYYGKLTLSFPNANYKLVVEVVKGLPVVDFQPIVDFMYPRQKLINDLAMVKPFVYRDSVGKSTLSFINWLTANNGQLIYQATDGKQAITHNSKVVTGSQFNVCLRGDFAAEVLTMAKRISGDYLTVTLGSDYISFKSADVEIIGTLPKVFDAYPDITKTIESVSKQSASIIVNVSQLLKGLRMAQKFQNHDESVGVIAEVGKGLLTLSPADGLSYKINITAETQGSGRFNLHAAKRVITLIPNSATVELLFMTSQNPKMPSLLKIVDSTTTKILSITSLETVTEVA